MQDLTQYMNLSHQELERLSPAIRIAVKRQRWEAREVHEPVDMPTEQELWECDVRLGLIRDYDDVQHPVYVKDNYGTRYDPVTKTYSRGDRSVKPVMGESSLRNLDAPTRKDQAHNRYLQGGGAVAQTEFNRYRFIVQQLRNTITTILGQIGRGDVIALMNKGDFEALEDAIKTLPSDAIYGRDEDASLADLFSMMRSCAVKRNKAEYALDTSPTRPRASTD